MQKLEATMRQARQDDVPFRMERFLAEASKDLALAGVAVFQGIGVAEGLWGYESLRLKLDEIQAAGLGWVLILGGALPCYLFWLAVVNVWPWWRKRRSTA